MKKNFFIAIRMTLVCLVLFPGIYTLIFLGIAKISPGSGEGERISANGKTYYTNIGQVFNEDRYFWSRPSAVDYNAAGSCGSNKGPTNPDYLALVQERIDTFMVHNPGVNISEIPIDLVTASGSGLDPHISVQAANVQARRVAQVRGLNEEIVRQLIVSSTEQPVLGLFGPERINVLKLNLELDNINK